MKTKNAFGFTPSEEKRLGVGFVSLSAAAQRLGKSRSQLRREVEGPELEATLRGGRLLIHRSDLAAYQARVRP